jgi:hypothetical protein
LTATTAVLIAGKIVNGDVRPGSYTPAQYFGPDLILEAPGTTRNKVLDFFRRYYVLIAA